MTPIWPRRCRIPARFAFLLLSVSLLSLNGGCGRTAAKLKVAYLGLTCEAPIFVAQEKGFYKEEGLDVELVRTDWDGLREGLGLGRFDANHTLMMYLLKPIEQGLDVKITGGVHTGCLRLQVAKGSKIESVKELKGKRIGIPTHIGSPPFLFASRVLLASGIDPDPQKKDVTWLAFPPEVLGKALEDGRVDAIGTSDPIGTILLGTNLVRTIADQAEDAPYRDEYCCVVVVSGKLAKSNPAAAAKVTRALFKASKWVEENPTAAAKLSVGNGYVATSAEINAQALVKLRYLPGVAKCRQSILQAAKEMRAAGLLGEALDAQQLTDRAWLDLAAENVTDNWLANLRVEKVADGGRPNRLSPQQFAALWADRKSCCGGCCCVE